MCRVIRHHRIPRRALFTPAKARGGADSKILSSRREAEVKCTSGEVEREVSGWRNLELSHKLMKGAWIGRTIFEIKRKDAVRICALATSGETVDISRSLKAGWETKGEDIRKICEGRKAIARSDPEFG